MSVEKKSPNKDAIDAVDHALGFITFDDFLKVDIRVGKIVAVEAVPKSDKLVKMQVDFGELGTRQVLAGIAKSYADVGLDVLVGYHALFVVNLAPRKMMGLESHGMVLAGNTRGGLPSLTTCQFAEPGTKIG